MAYGVNCIALPTWSERGRVAAGRCGWFEWLVSQEHGAGLEPGWALRLHNFIYNEPTRAKTHGRCGMHVEDACFRPPEQELEHRGHGRTLLRVGLSDSAAGLRARYTSALSSAPPGWAWPWWRWCPPATLSRISALVLAGVGVR